MREILFRGKPKDKDCQMFKNLQIHMQDGFIYGFLIVIEHTYYICTSAIKTDKSYVNNTVATMVEVVPETVGQYTGLTDKNGKKIFEGDIVKTDKFSEPNKQYIIKYDLQFGAFIGHDRYNCYFVTFDGDSDEFEVIGNVHDSTEIRGLDDICENSDEPSKTEFTLPEFNY